MIHPEDLVTLKVNIQMVKNLMSVAYENIESIDESLLAENSFL